MRIYRVESCCRDFWMIELNEFIEKWGGSLKRIGLGKLLHKKNCFTLPIAILLVWIGANRGFFINTLNEAATWRNCQKCFDTLLEPAKLWIFFYYCFLVKSTATERFFFKLSFWWKTQKNWLRKKFFFHCKQRMPTWLIRSGAQPPADQLCCTHTLSSQQCKTVEIVRQVEIVV